MNRSDEPIAKNAVYGPPGKWCDFPDHADEFKNNLRRQVCSLRLVRRNLQSHTLPRCVEVRRATAFSGDQFHYTFSIQSRLMKSKVANHHPLLCLFVNLPWQVWRRMGINLNLPVDQQSFQRREDKIFEDFYRKDWKVSAEARQLFAHLRTAKSAPDKLDWPWKNVFVTVYSGFQLGLVSNLLEEQGITVGHCLTNSSNTGNMRWERSDIYDIDLLIQRSGSPLCDIPDFGPGGLFPDIERCITSLVQPGGTLRGEESHHSFLYVGARRLLAASQQGWHPIFLDTSVGALEHARGRAIFKSYPRRSSQVHHKIDTIRKADDLIHWRPPLRPAQVAEVSAFASGLG